MSRPGPYDEEIKKTAIGTAVLAIPMTLCAIAIIICSITHTWIPGLSTATQFTLRIGTPAEVIGTLYVIFLAVVTPAPKGAAYARRIAVAALAVAWVAAVYVTFVYTPEDAHRDADPFVHVWHDHRDAEPRNPLSH